MANASSTGSQAVGEADTATDDRGARFERDARGAVDPKQRLRETQRRQREEFGGLHWGSAFFGWLVAVGIAVLLVAIVSAAGAAIGLTSASRRRPHRARAGPGGAR